jgi:integrase
MKPTFNEAVKEAARVCHLEGLTPHYLRHAFASHAVLGGAFVRDLHPEQQLKSRVLTALFSVRSERSSCEQLGYNLLWLGRWRR